MRFVQTSAAVVVVEDERKRPSRPKPADARPTRQPRLRIPDIAAASSAPSSTSAASNPGSRMPAAARSAFARSRSAAQCGEPCVVCAWLCVLIVREQGEKRGARAHASAAICLLASLPVKTASTPAPPIKKPPSESLKKKVRRQSNSHTHAPRRTRRPAGARRPPTRRPAPARRRRG